MALRPSPELLRLAVLLCGSWDMGQHLFAQAARHAEAGDDAGGCATTVGGPAAAAASDDAHAATQAWIVRGFLSEGAELGAAPAADVNRPRAIVPVSGEDPLMGRLRASSKLQRAVLVLGYVHDLDDAGIARVVGSTPAAIGQYRAHVLRTLGVSPDGRPRVGGTAGEAVLRRLVDQLDREAYLAPAAQVELDLAGVRTLHDAATQTAGSAAAAARDSPASLAWDGALTLPRRTRPTPPEPAAKSRPLSRLAAAVTRRSRTADDPPTPRSGEAGSDPDVPWRHGDDAGPQG